MRSRYTTGVDTRINAVLAPVSTRSGRPHGISPEGALPVGTARLASTTSTISALDQAGVGGIRLTGPTVGQPEIDKTMSRLGLSSPQEVAHSSHTAQSRKQAFIC